MRKSYKEVQHSTVHNSKKYVDADIYLLTRNMSTACCCKKIGNKTTYTSVTTHLQYFYVARYGACASYQFIAFQLQIYTLLLALQK